MQGNEVIFMNERIVFMGTADFSGTVLQMLIDEHYNVVGVVSQPDRQVGRKKKTEMTLVKKLALAHDIPVVQPAKIRTDYADVVAFEPDLIITAAYGQIVPNAILGAPRLGCVNVHASLLPKYRGGAPVHQAIIDGNKETGVTIMYMAEKMDAGDLIAQRSTPIDDTDTVGKVYDRLAALGAELLKDTLPSILNGTNSRTPQDESQVTFAPVIKRGDERLDWDMSARDVFNKVRGLDPWPGCYSVYQGANVKIWAGHVHECANAASHEGTPAGTIIKIFKDAIGVKCGTGIYLITELQMPGKRRMSVKDYLNGKNIFEEGERFEQPCA